MDRQEIYIIQFNGMSISKEGYYNLENAIMFINSRNFNPKPVRALMYEDDQNNEYKILPINIK